MAVLPRLVDTHADLLALHGDHHAVHPFPVADADGHLAADLDAFFRHRGARLILEFFSRLHHPGRRSAAYVFFPRAYIHVAARPTVGAEAVALVVAVAALVALALPLAAAPRVDAEALATIVREAAFVAVAVRPGFDALAVLFALLEAALVF